MPLERRGSRRLPETWLLGSETRFPSCGGRVVLVNEVAENVSPTDVFGDGDGGRCTCMKMAGEAA